MQVWAIVGIVEQVLFRVCHADSYLRIHLDVDGCVSLPSGDGGKKSS
jgi:hypothetical protein